jgi:hypothetical protein
MDCLDYNTKLDILYKLELTVLSIKGLFQRRKFEFFLVTFALFHVVRYLVCLFIDLKIMHVLMDLVGLFLLQSPPNPWPSLRHLRL